MVRGEFTFTGRSRRPPRDPINALLSFGYTLLTTEMTGALAAQGLDPFVGILHDLDYGRPSLALDLLEEFRQPVIDRLVLSIVNRGALKAEHFDDRGEAGVLLNDTGRPRFLEFYHRALETAFTERGEESPTNYRALLLRQAERLRAAILVEAEYVAYLPR
jgi:CRISPR-associated protein Cas1